MNNGINIGNQFRTSLLLAQVSDDNFDIETIQFGAFGVIGNSKSFDHVAEREQLSHEIRAESPGRSCYQNFVHWSLLLDNLGSFTV